MRRLLRPVASRTMRASVPQYNPEANDAKFKAWWGRLSSIATTPVSKVHLAQLSNLLAHYNRTVQDNTAPIDFDSWRSKIITKGLVNNLEKHYNEQASQNYDLDKVFTEIFSKDSKAIDTINNEMAFHTAIWLNNYGNYVQWLSDVETFGNYADYTTAEMVDFFPRAEVASDALMETHSYLPGSHDDTNLYGFMMIQFDWGKRLVTFYAHPTMDNKGGRATKNAMGR